MVSFVIPMGLKCDIDVIIKLELSSSVIGQGYKFAASSKIGTFLWPYTVILKTVGVRVQNVLWTHRKSGIASILNTYALILGAQMSEIQNIPE